MALLQFGQRQQHDAGHVEGGLCHLGQFAHVDQLRAFGEQAARGGRADLARRRQFDARIHDAAPAASHCSILSRPGTPPACTTLPSITTPGVLITP